MRRGLFGTPPVVHVGFTGTQDGQTSAQQRKVRQLLKDIRGDFFHHGDCVGSDAQAHEIALALKYRVILHPPVEPRKRANCEGAIATREEKPYLKRNQDIVRECSVVIATPKSYQETIRSGTWSTVRKAVDMKRRVLVVYPDGRVHERTENVELFKLPDSE